MMTCITGSICIRIFQKFNATRSTYKEVGNKLQLNNMKNILAILCFLLLLAACKSKEATPHTGTCTTPALPANWNAVDSAQSVILGSRTYDRQEDSLITDYVVIVNLAAGGSVRLLDSVYTADTCSPLFNSYSVTDTAGPSFWKFFSNTSSFAMANLQFFNYNGAQYPQAEVCYPVYHNGSYRSQGCADGTCQGDQGLTKRILIISDTISVQDYPDSIPCINYPIPAAARIAVVGNNPLATREGNTSNVGRTYLAKQGNNLVMYSSPSATEKDVYELLQKEFGILATDIVMFDGGGSSQMICKGVVYVPSSDKRWVPSAIEIRGKGK